MRQPVVELDPAPRHPRMVLAPHLEWRVLGQQVAGLRKLALTREHRPRHDQRLRPRPALGETPAHQQLIRPDLGYARTSSTPALLMRSAFRTVSTICGALSRASSYCFSGLSCSWKRSGNRMVRILRPASTSPSSLASVSTCAPKPPIEASSTVAATSCVVSRRRIISLSSGLAKRRSATVADRPMA